MRAFYPVLLSLSMLTACAVPQATDTVRSEPIPYRLDGDGIALADRPQRVDFGRTDHSAIKAMTKLVGRGPTDQAMCGDGVQRVSWPDGTSLYFRRGAFRGWSVDGDVPQVAGVTC